MFIVPISTGPGPYREINAISSETEIAKRQIETLESQLDRLHLITQGLWELVQTKTGLTDEELLAKIEEVDLRDGRLDGKIRPQPADCDQCGRKVSIRTNSCLYCGAKAAATDPFK